MLNVIAVDDEIYALKNLEDKLRLVLSESDKIEAFSYPEDAIAYNKKEKVDIAFLDIEMYGISGIGLARELKLSNPEVNIVFVTAYSEYALDAIKERASGYLLKPVHESDIIRELDELRNPIPPIVSEKPWIQTFGYFEVFMDGTPIHFRRSKSKELLAYLVDRRGASISGNDIAAVLWENPMKSRELNKYVSTCVTDLMKDLREAGAEKIISRNRGKIAINMNEVECDYYNFLKGNPRAINSFNNEYMSNYSWAEFTLGGISQNISKIL